MCALAVKIECSGIKPTKSEVYKLAAELVELEGIESFKSALIEAFRSYDYYDYYADYDYHYHYYYNDDNADYDYSLEEKVIALLFLSAMYAD